MKKRVRAIGIAVLSVLAIVGVYVICFFLTRMSGERGLETLVNKLPFFVFLLLLYGIVLVSMMLHIAVHELGHVIFGKLTGYRFLSYRFMSIGVFKKKGKWKVFRMHIPGTAGQALMKPPKVGPEGKKPYFWYNAGGVLMNLFVVLLSFLICMVTTNGILYLFAIMSAIMGLALALANGIPYSEKGISDGCNILQFYKYPERLDNFYLQLSVVASLSRGKTWKKFSPEEFEDDTVPDNVFSMIPKLYQINTYYARKEFGRARKVVKSLVPYKERVTKIYGNVITVEELFQELIGENDPRKVDKLYTKQVQKFVKAMRFEASMWRVQMAYEWFHEQDEVAAMVCYEQIRKIREHTMFPGDVELELSLAEYIKKRMEQTDVLHFE